VGLENWSRDLGFRNYLEELSLFGFIIVVWTKGRLRNSFLKKFFLLKVGLGMEYMKLFVGKVVDSKTRGSCIPTNSMKGRDDYPNLVHNTGIAAYIDSDKTNLAYLVG